MPRGVSENQKSRHVPVFGTNLRPTRFQHRFLANFTPSGPFNYTAHGDKNETFPFSASCMDKVPKWEPKWALKSTNIAENGIANCKGDPKRPNWTDENGLNRKTWEIQRKTREKRKIPSAGPSWPHLAPAGLNAGAIRRPAIEKGGPSWNDPPKSESQFPYHLKPFGQQV